MRTQVAGAHDARPKAVVRTLNFKQIKDEKRRQFATMLTALDDNIGRLMKRLKEMGLEENTLVFLLSDNGGYPYNTSVNTPLSGYKSQLAEGGIRVPFLVRWPGRLQSNTEYRQPVIAHDILPTALAAAGVALPEGAKVDGVNLLPFLTGTSKGDPHEALYWELDGTSALAGGRCRWAARRARDRNSMTWPPTAARKRTCRPPSRRRPRNSTRCGRSGTRRISLFAEAGEAKGGHNRGIEMSVDH